jgi:hypothetical protein
MIANCQLPIFDWRLAIEPIGNRQSQIENPGTHPLPRGGTDLMGSHLSQFARANCISTQAVNIALLFSLVLVTIFCLSPNKSPDSRSPAECSIAFRISILKELTNEH